MLMNLLRACFQFENPDFAGLRKGCSPLEPVRFQRTFSKQLQHPPGTVSVQPLEPSLCS